MLMSVDRGGVVLRWGKRSPG